MVLFLGVCSESKTPAVAAPDVVEASDEASAPAGRAISGTIVETMDAAGYTYILVDTGVQKVWAAGPQAAVEVGEAVDLPGGMAMQNFESQTLGRTFDVIFFVGSLKGIDGTGPAGQRADIPQAISGHGATSGKAAPEKPVDLNNIAKASGGHTVAELFSGKEELADQETAVRGRVVKYNAGIMGRNWIHLRDGSGSEGSNDLTVTTADTAKVGDLVVIRGRVKTDQDFGHGYSYDLMVEEAKVDIE
ncbi:MAG: hypothetical protein ACC649_00155 [Myxococcota bacterium]